MACEESTPLTIIKGADFGITVELVDENDDPIDLTNFTTYMEVRERDNHSSPRWLVVTTAIDSPSTAGLISVSIPSSVTEGLPWVRGFYDLFIISSSNVRTKVLKGQITVENSVSF